MLRGVEYDELAIPGGQGRANGAHADRNSASYLEGRLLF